jgi:hypothetical protein
MPTIRRHITEYGNTHNYHCEDIKSNPTNFFLYKLLGLCYSMEQSSCEEANSRSASREILQILWNKGGSLAAFKEYFY